MIEPKVHTPTNGIIGQQHGLTKLTDTLEALTQGQTAQQQRDAGIQQQLTSLAQSLMVWWRRLPVLEVLLAAGLTLCGGVLAWHLVDRHADTPYARALGQIDQTLVQQAQNQHLNHEPQTAWNSL